MGRDPAKNTRPTVWLVTASKAKPVVGCVVPRYFRELLVGFSQGLGKVPVAAAVAEPSREPPPELQRLAAREQAVNIPIPAAPPREAECHALLS